jgi:hypothetical protein
MLPSKSGIKRLPAGDFLLKEGVFAGILGRHDR